MERRKTKTLMNKPVYLGQAILDISKTLMYEFWYDYIQPKYKEKAKLFYMDTDSFIIHIFTEDFYKDIAMDVNKWFDTRNYDKNDKKTLRIAINKKIIEMLKDELRGKIMAKLCGRRSETYAFLLDNNTEKKRVKGTKKCVIKRRLKFNDYTDSLFNNKTILRLHQRFKSDHHTIHTEEINKAAITSNEDKWIRTFDKVTTYPYGTSVFKICESEMLSLRK